MSMFESTMIDALPAGPLDLYRKKAKFDWKKLKLVFEDPSILQIKQNVWKILEKDPLFERTNEELLVDQQKRITALQLQQFRKYTFMPTNGQKASIKDRLFYMFTIFEVLSAAYPDVSIKHVLGVSLFQNTLCTLGTERHHHVIESLRDTQILSALALTEVAHGSDAKNIKTTATYDKSTQEFVINTPDFKSAKCWVGNLGKMCTMTLLFAQLYTEGQCYGLHAFIVPIRNPRTLLPYPGIIVGDMGEKIGFNGIDNGFIMFQNYRIPRENLLNRTADVTPEGEYDSSFSDPSKSLRAALESLSAGRIGVMQGCTNHLISAVTIAIRYAALRTQFGPNGSDELPIIEYEIHQWRLFPYVAAAAVLKVFLTSVITDYLNALETSKTGNEDIDRVRDMASELHAIISASKPLITWTARDAIQECREACGGHGYLKASRFGELRNIVDAAVTFEGDNNVLVQQTSNWLLRQWSNVIENGDVQCPLASCSFLKDHTKILNLGFQGSNTKDVTKITFLYQSYQWLITYLIKITNDKFSLLLNEKQCRFTARNKCQVYKAAVLSRAFGEYMALVYYWKRIGQCDVDVTLRPELEKLGILYGLSCLDKHCIYFYQGNFANGYPLAALIKEGVLHMSGSLKDDVVSIIDSLAHPDFVINSYLGKSDGKLYENIQAEFFNNPGSMSRPAWWREIKIDNNYCDKNIRSKI